MTDTPKKWTPGPWSVKDFNADDLQRPNRFEGPVVVYADEDCETHPVADCSCNHTCRDGEIARANARLIAAAPALYEALEKLLVAAVEVGGLPEYGQVLQARAALALANGEGG